MVSFDIANLYTNVPLKETAHICVDALYRGYLGPPSIQEPLFLEVLTLAKEREWSLALNMYAQIYGVSMCNPLHPFLGNFVYLSTL